jgi:hypothetical protein
MKLLKLFTLICCCFFYSNSYAQSPKEIEPDLLKSFKKISYWNNKQMSGNLSATDSLEKANEIFNEKLKYYTEKYPETIGQKFSSLAKEHLHMLTSSDGLFRIYSWNTWMGGTMQDFVNVFQYKTDGKTSSILDTAKSADDYVYYYSNLYTIKIKGETYYIAVYDGIFSSKDAGNGIRFFTIKDGKLNDDVKLIKTPSGMHSRIYYDYDFFSVLDWKVRPSIYFNASNKTIHVPVVADNGKVTHKYITYKFTGKYFEKVKN